jgi:L-malate glycosyltransferase
VSAEAGAGLAGDSNYDVSVSAQSILHVLWSMDIGGAERAVYQLVREQRRTGIEADVLVGSCAGFYGERTEEVGSRVYQLGLRGVIDPHAARRAKAIFGRYESAHFHGPEPILMATAARQAEIRLFYTHRGGVRTYSFKKRLRHALVALYLRRRFNGVSANTLQSARAAARIFKIPLDSISVVYNGLDFDLLEPKRSVAEVRAEFSGVSDRAFLVGTAANLQSWKRIDLLLRAVARLDDDCVHCIVLGEGPARFQLEQLARELGLEGRVTFVGQKKHVGDYLQVLDAFVLPSGPEEGFGNAAVEAMGVGLPVVVFEDGGGLSEHIEHAKTGFVVPDLGGLEDALRELVRSPNLRQVIGERGRHAARERYNLKAMLDGYQSFYGSSCRL